MDLTFQHSQPDGNFKATTGALAKPGNPSTISSLWQQLEADRSAHLALCEKCAKYTIPSVFPPKNTKPDDPKLIPNQSLGSLATNKLGSKLMTIFFPLNNTWMRIDPDRALADPRDNEDVQEILHRAEQDVSDVITHNGIRRDGYTIARNLIVVGGIMTRLEPDITLSMWRKDNYVARYDGSGNLLDIIVRDFKNARYLPDDIVELIEREKGKKIRHMQSLPMYTWIRRGPDGNWLEEMEIFEVVVAGDTYTEETFPYFPFEWEREVGESEGHGLVERMLGDFMQVDSFALSQRKYAAAASKLLLLLKPNAFLQPSDVKEAEDLDILIGNPDDISPIQFDKLADFRVVFEMAQTITRRIMQAFLMNEAVTRDAERVTAEEIRYIAQALEDALGGVFSNLTIQFKRLLLAIMKRVLDSQPETKLQLESLGVNYGNIDVFVGIDVMARNHEQEKLRNLISTAEASGKMHYLKGENLLKRIARNDNLNANDLIFTEEEVQQQAQQQQMQDAAAQALPGMAQGITQETEGQ